MTGVILAAITAASFAVWMIPQNTQTRFVVTNAAEEIDAIIDQQRTISDTITEEFDKMLNGEITQDNYITIAEVSSSQINSLIISTIESDISSEWQDSYSALVDSLRSYNSYIRETVVVAEKLKVDPNADISEERANLDEFLKQTENYLSSSDSARPS